MNRTLAVEPEAANRTAQIEVIIAEDRLRAWIRQPNLAAPSYQPPKRDEVVAALTAAQLEISDQVMQHVDQFVTLAASAGAGDSANGPPEIPEKFLVAKGTAPVEPQDGTFTFHDALQQDDIFDSDAASIDYFAMISIKTVEAGAAVGKLEPPTQGIPGRDVFGHKLPPKRSSGTAIKLGPGLRASDDGREVITEIPGRVFCERGKLRIDDSLAIKGDVNFDSGSLDVCVDVHIRGTVQSHFQVRTTKSLTVDRAIEAADVDVAGDITVRGGISGHRCAGQVRSGGNVTARFCNEADLEVSGDLRFEKETLNSRVRAGERIISARGTIIGGDVWAREGIEVAALGSEAGVLTRAAVGVPLDALRRVRQLEKDVRERARAAEKTRQRLAPLVAEMKRLTPAQREAATELISKANELDDAAQAAQAERDATLEALQPRGTPAVLVHRLIRPNVRITIGAWETQIDHPIQGPVRIEQRKLDGTTAIVAIDQRSGSLTELPTTAVDLDAGPEDETDVEGGSDATEQPGSGDE